MENYRKSDPQFEKIVNSGFYVDDLNTIVKTSNEKIEFYEKCKILFAKEGFNVRKWRSKDPTLKRTFAEKKVKFENLENGKVSGINWDHNGDFLIIRADANSRLKTRVMIPTLIKSDETKAESSSDKAEELNYHFRSVFTTEDTNNIPESNNYYSGEKLNTIEISTEMVKNILLNLNDNKPSGADEIHPYFIKKLASCLSDSITKSLNSGTNPIQWQEVLRPPRKNHK